MIHLALDRALPDLCGAVHRRAARGQALLQRAPELLLGAGGRRLLRVRRAILCGAASPQTKPMRMMMRHRAARAACMHDGVSSREMHLHVGNVQVLSASSEAASALLALPSAWAAGRRGVAVPAAWPVVRPTALA